MPTSAPPIRLDPSEIVSGRPFTNPDRNAEDLALIEYMRKRLCRLLSQTRKLPDQPRPLILHFLEDDVRKHRIVLSRPEALLSASTLVFVGFCGRKRNDVDKSVLDHVDVELIGEFRQHPDLLSYSSLELQTGDWRNLVLMGRPRGIEHWQTSARHRYAARELAPKYYTNVRLHRGLLSGGLMSNNEPVIIETKYYDFEGRKLWRAVREIQVRERRKRGATNR